MCGLNCIIVIVVKPVFSPSRMLPAGVIPSCEAMVKQRTSIVAQISKGRRYALDIVIAKERSELSGPIEFVLIANFPVDINRC